MKNSIKIGLCALILSGYCLAARDLKAELTAMAPNGQHIRLVYQKGGTPNENNGYGNSNSANQNTALYTVSSEDGIIRKIYPSGTGTGNYHSVHITYDGSRVVCYDYGRSQVVIVNYDGTNPKTFNATGMGYDYYYNTSDKTEWFITSDDNTVYKYNINVAAPAREILLANAASFAGSTTISDAASCSISDDGTKLLLCKESSSGAFPSMVNLSTKIAKTMTIPGCWYMTRGGVNSSGKVEFSQNSGFGINAVAGHRGPTIQDEDGKVIQLVNVSDTLTKWIAKAENKIYDAASTSCYPEEGYAVDGLRWLRNRGYFSVIAERIKIGPILWRMSDNKWTFIEDNISCTYAGDMDGITGIFSTNAINQKVSPEKSITDLNTSHSFVYSINGRNLSNQTTTTRSLPAGIIIRQLANGKFLKSIK